MENAIPAANVGSAMSPPGGAEFTALASTVLNAVGQARANKVNSDNVIATNMANRQIARETNRANLQNALLANNANSLTSQVRQFRAAGGSLQGAFGNVQQQAAVAPTAETGSPQQVPQVVAPDFTSLVNVAQLLEQRRVNDSIINVNNANALEKNYSNEDKQSAQAAWSKINEAFVSGDLDIEDLRSASYAAKKSGVDLSGLRPSAVAALEDIAQQAYNGYKADVGYNNTQQDTNLKEAQTSLIRSQERFSNLSSDKIAEELKHYPEALALARRMQQVNIDKIMSEKWNLDEQAFAKSLESALFRDSYEMQVQIKDAERYIMHNESRLAKQAYNADQTSTHWDDVPLSIYQYLKDIISCLPFSAGATKVIK